MTIPYPPTPELDRLRELDKTGANRHVQEFLDWLLDEEEWAIVKFTEGSEIPVYAHDRRERLMYRHFAIDPDKIEAERRALLDYQRALNETPGQPR